MYAHIKAPLTLHNCWGLTRTLDGMCMTSRFQKTMIQYEIQAGNDSRRYCHTTIHESQRLYDVFIAEIDISTDDGSETPACALDREINNSYRTVTTLTWKHTDAKVSYHRQRLGSHGQMTWY